MVAEAEKFAAADEAQKKKIEAKNSLESYCHQIKNTLNQEQLQQAFTEEDKKVILDAS